jgi:hypothetical protein
MSWQVEKMQSEVLSWAGVTEHPHRFDAREFRFGDAEIGHVHAGGVVDIPFPRPMRDELVAQGLAEGHRWVPNSGWTTFHVGNEADLRHAIWLMRLSYARYAIKKADDPRRVFAEESRRLALGEPFVSMLRRFVPETSELASDPETTVDLNAASVRGVDEDSGRVSR